MIRKIFKKKQTNSKIKDFIKKYKVPHEYLSINRKSISRGVLIGLFWGFIPMPMQMLAVLAITPFTKFNVPIAITMVWLSNPVTMPFMYYMEYQTGNYLLNLEGIKDANFNFDFSISWFKENWSNFLYPLYVGTIPYSIGVSSLMYFSINKLWIDSVKKEKSHRKKRFFKSLKKRPL
jgi:uncharacterized protein (DUF2062 family)